MTLTKYALIHSPGHKPTHIHNGMLDKIRDRQGMTTEQANFAFLSHQHEYLFFVPSAFYDN